MHDHTLNLDELEKDIDKLCLIVEKFRISPLFPMPNLPSFSTEEPVNEEYNQEIRDLVKEFAIFNSQDWDEAAPKMFNFSSEAFIEMPDGSFLYLLPRILKSVLAYHVQSPKILDSLTFSILRMERRNCSEFLENELSKHEIELLKSVVERVNQIIKGNTNT